MLAEAIELIQKTAQQASGLTTHPLEVRRGEEPRRLIIAHDGEHEIIDLAFVPKLRAPVTETFEDFGRAYESYGCVAAEAAPAPSSPPAETTAVAVARPGVKAAGLTPRSTVWVNVAGASFQFDEADRREQCSIAFVFSKYWETVRQFEKKSKADHKAFVRLLRHDLLGCVDPYILTVFRDLDFEAINRARSIQEKQKQSLDSSVMAEVRGAEKPEQFLVSVPVFKNRELAGHRVEISITIDLDAASREIVLQAAPDALELALDNALEDAAGKIEAALPDGTVVLRGKP